jgi:type II secretory pathway component PulC
MEPTKPVKLADAVKEALAKKQQTIHPDTKLSKTQQKAAKRGTPASTGKPMRKVTGRGG